jgi:DNA polymerase-3 subunit delta
VNYFGANIRSNPLVLTMGSLYGYFSKIYLYHQLKPKSDAEIASMLSLRPIPVILNEYKATAKNYPAQKVEQVMQLLHEYDLRSKGVNDTGSKEGALLKELVYKILH